MYFLFVWAFVMYIVSRTPERRSVEDGAAKESVNIKLSADVHVMAINNPFRRTIVFIRVRTKLYIRT